MQRSMGKRRHGLPKYLRPQPCTNLVDASEWHRIAECSPKYPLETPEEKARRETAILQLAADAAQRSLSGCAVERWANDVVKPFLNKFRPGSSYYTFEQPLSDFYHVAVHYYWVHTILGQEDLAANQLYASRELYEKFMSDLRQKRTYGSSISAPPPLPPSSSFSRFGQDDRSPHGGNTVPPEQTSKKRGKRDRGWSNSQRRHKIPKHESQQREPDYSFNYPQHGGPSSGSSHSFTLDGHRPSANFRAIGQPEHASQPAAQQTQPYQAQQHDGHYIPVMPVYGYAPRASSVVSTRGFMPPFSAATETHYHASTNGFPSSNDTKIQARLPVASPVMPKSSPTGTKSVIPSSLLTPAASFPVKKEPFNHLSCFEPTDPTQPPEVRTPLTKYPPIWSQTRQEVCESFEWFRSYQAGVYFVNDIAKGYLLSAFGARRDAFCNGGKLIVSHGGGRAESLHSEKGNYTLKEAEDQQANDKSVRALLKTFKEGRPIALIIDDRYPLFPFDLSSKDVTYAVLGFYMIVHAWAEYQGGSSNEKRVIKYKFAFQWCEGQGEPWWTSPTGMPATPDDGSGLEAKRPNKAEEVDMDPCRGGAEDEISMRCKHCREFSPHVYEVSWACLNPACVVFWRVKDTDTYLHDDLKYQVDFLRPRKPTYLPIGYDSLRPPPVKERDDGVTTSAAFTRGYHCPNCGRLSCRTEWKHWKCNTPGCDRVYRIEPRVHAANEFCFAPISSSNKFDFEWIDKDCGLVRKPLRSFAIGKKGTLGQIQTIVLPKGRGFLHHIRSNSPASIIQANDIFDQYQQDANGGDLRFRRWPMRAHKCRGALLTNYFSHNAGEPYHYVGGTENTVPFDQAPKAVIQARDLIKSRIADALRQDVEFNEVLTAAYMEKQKMAFHSDDEKGLGPLVAGLSLGSPALMHFRLMKSYSKNGDHKHILASFVLRHGDVMVMEGADVQQYYEHTVVPTNFRIAATARFINPGFEDTQVKLIKELDAK